MPIIASGLTHVIDQAERREEIVRHSRVVTDDRRLRLRAERRLRSRVPARPPVADHELANVVRECLSVWTSRVLADSRARHAREVLGEEIGVADRIQGRADA